MSLLQKTVSLFSKKSNDFFCVGLGNLGEKYIKTRHNVGWLFLDYLVAQTSDAQNWTTEKKILSTTKKISLNTITVTLVKPQTYMNKSGDAISAIIKFYKIPPQNIVIVHDDVDLPLGQYKFTTSAGSAGHNGIKSIFNSLNTQTITRIRIGIGKSDTIPTDAYVLQTFGQSELEKLHDLFPAIKNVLTQHISQYSK